MAERCSRLLLLPLLLLTLTVAAQPAATPPTLSANLAGSRQLLDWLGVDAIIAQTPQIADQALQSEAKFRKADTAQTARWRQTLSARLNPTALRERIARRIAAETDAATLQQALTQLQMPLSKRVRYFELAMAQPGAGLGFQEFRTQLDTTPPTPARRQLVRAVTAAAGSDQLLALWQSAISAEVWLVAAGQPQPAQVRNEAAKERERHLEPLDEVYALYAYRYLTDAELATYRDILTDSKLGDSAVQRVLEICHRNLAQAFTE